MYVKLNNCVVLEPGTRDWRVIDIGIRDGKVEAMGEVADGKADRVIDIGRRFVSPAWVDLHTHVYRLGTSLGVDADSIGRMSGVGVFVDAGSSGAGNFSGFKEHVIKRSKVKIYSFLNIGFGGIPFFGIQRGSQAGEIPKLEVADPEACVQCIRKNRRLVVGIKVRLSAKANGELGRAPLRIAKKCARSLGIPVMLHIGMPPPDVEDLIGLLGPGDILTHTFRPEPNSILDGEAHVSRAVKAAKRRGVVIDVGHGIGSFSYRVAQASLQEAFPPDVISTDLHAFSVPSPVHDLPTTMTKLLNLGMPIEDVVNAVTHNPAKAIHRPRHGRISQGELADMVVFEIAHMRTTLKDSVGEERTFAKVIRPLLRVEGGVVRKIPWIASST